MAEDNENEVQAPAEDLKSDAGKKQSMLKKIPTDNKRQTLYIIAGSLLVVLAGVVTGWQLSGGAAATGEKLQASNVTPGDEGDVSEAGVADASEFETIEEGVLREGGFEGEGTHHLEKEGVSQEKYPYLTSAVIDLQSFVDKKVQVWGHTIAGQKAGWLVDVGKIKVIED